VGKTASRHGTQLTKGRVATDRPPAVTADRKMKNLPHINQ
jgi:hypothetical protein